VRELIDLGRLAASGGNQQPLKYMISADPDANNKIFPHTRWAGSLPDWPGPAEGERPAAYIVILRDNNVSKGHGCDQGIAAQNIVLGAMERGIGACMIGSLDRPAIAADLNVPEQFDIVLVIALGVPGETVILEDVGPEGSTTYYRDDHDNHHVPKRTLAEVIVSF